MGKENYITIIGETTGTWLTTNGRGVSVYWNLACGVDRYGSEGWQTPASAGNAMATSNQVNFLGTTSATFQIALPQLEVGDTATPFEHRPYDMELARCQRYFTKSYNQGVAVGSNTWIGTFAGRNYDTDTLTSHGSSMLFPVSMRATPTLTAYSKAGTSGKGVEGSSSIDISSTEVTCTIRGSANGIRGVDMSVTGTKFYQFHFTADSEL